MARKSKLEDIAKGANPAPQMNSGSSQLKTNSIDDITENTGKRNFYNKGLVGKLFDYALGGAAVAGAVALMGPVALVGPATAILGDYIVNRRKGKKLSSRQIRDNLLIGSILSIPAIFGFNLMNQYIPMDTWKGILTRAFVQSVPFYGTLMPLGYGVDYLVRPHKDKSLKNMWEKGIKPYWWRNWRDGTAIFTIPNQLAANFLPPIWHYPVSRGLGLTYRATIGQRHIKDLDPYDLNSENGNGSDRKPAPKPNYSPASAMQPQLKPA